MISVLLVTFTLGQPSNNLGPGSGPWQTATPESQVCPGFELVYKNSPTQTNSF